MLKTRLQQLIKLIKENRLNALFVTNPTNIYYLTGFKGISPIERESVVLVGKNNLTLFAPKLYQQEVKKFAKENKVKLKIIEERNCLFLDPPKLFPPNSRVGVESTDLTLAEFKKLKKDSRAKLVATEGVVEELRLTKDKEELKFIKKAVKITDQTFQRIPQEIRIGMTEKNLARRIKAIMEEMGADGVAFEPIVAGGTSSVLPHYESTNKKIARGLLLIDAGAKYKGYNGDLTRTFFIGKPDQLFISRYKLLLNVQEKLIKQIKAGMTEETAWKMAYKSLGEEAQYFIHGLGHGLGLEIHEAPYLRKERRNFIKANSVVTIEPGIYYPGWGGIRIEDSVLLTNENCQVLSKATKNAPIVQRTERRFPEP